MRGLRKPPISIDYQSEKSPPVKIKIPMPYNFSDAPYPLPETMGDGFIRICSHKDGLGFGEIQTGGALEKLVCRVTREGRVLRLPFVLSKEPVRIGIEGCPMGRRVDSTMSVLLPYNKVSAVYLEPDVPLDIISFHIPEQRIIQMLDELEVKPACALMRKMTDSAYGKTTPEIRQTIDQIRSCHMRGGLRCLFLEGKMLELVALRFQEYIYSSTKGRPESLPPLSRRDISKIHEAEEFISKHLENPLSIGQLSRRVGLNSTKLKKGFREELGYTVFGYIHHLRMEQAFILLRDTEKNISEIAYCVGYSNLSAFSAAFKRDYGISPSSVRKHDSLRK